MRILNTADMRAAEQAAVAAGTSYEQLMENAGAASAGVLEQLAAEAELDKRALFLCGRGNNAGDAFVAARLLAAADWRCAVLPLCGDDYSTLAKRNLLRLPAGVAQLPSLPAALDGWAFIVDGVFGIGFHGRLPDAVRAAFAAANAANACRVALDVPSGLDADTGRVDTATFHAAHTLTFGAHKPGLLVYGNAAYTGRVHCLDIGL